MLPNNNLFNIGNPNNKKKRKARTTGPNPIPEPTFDDNINYNIKYQVSKHVETNRDLYFIKMVAGFGKKSFVSLINAKKQEDVYSAINGAIIRGIQYTYTDELLASRNIIIEKIKTMTNDTWNDTDDIHEKMITNDSTCVSYSRYVAFNMMTEANSLIPINKTRYNINYNAEKENTIVLELMSAIHSQYGTLLQIHVDNYL